MVENVKEAQEIPPADEINEAINTEDDIKPSESACNVGSHKTSQSQCSSASSACLKAEAKLAVLAI